MGRRTKRFIPEPPIYRFHVTIKGSPMSGPVEDDVWREIEVAGNQTLLELGNEIPPAFDFDLDHLWSFYLSGKPFDPKTEYALIAKQNLFTGETPKRAEDHGLRGVHFPKREFLYIFDYGDEWHFGVELAGKSDEVDPRAAYPRVVAGHGEPPPQYPDAEEWDEEVDER